MTTKERLRILAATGIWDWPESARTFLLAALGDEDPECREQAASLLSQISDDEIAEALLAALESEDEIDSVRGAAAIALGPALEMCSVGDWEDDLEPPPLSAEGYAATQRRLRAVFEDEAAPKLVRRRALEAAVRAPEGWMADAARACFADEDADWKRTGLFAFGMLPGDFEREIVRGLGSDDAEVLREAVRAAGRAEIASAANAVITLAEESKDPILRRAAVEALSGLGGHRARDLLERLGDDEDEEIAEIASDALSLRDPLADDDELGDFDDDDEPLLH